MTHLEHDPAARAVHVSAGLASIPARLWSGFRRRCQRLRLVW